MSQHHSSFHEPSTTADSYHNYLNGLSNYFDRSPGPSVRKLESFTKFVPRTALARFLVRCEIFKQVLEVQGSVLEFGVLDGAGLMTWAQLSSIFEPANHQREIVGFDTFEGFPSVAEVDSRGSSAFASPGGFAGDSEANILEGVRLFDLTRFLGHIPKVSLVRGDVMESLPRWLELNPHCVASLVYLDLDLFEPTALALRLLADRVPKGGVIAFDELNLRTWPGETQAVMKEIGLSNLRLKRLPIGTSVSYAVVE